MSVLKAPPKQSRKATLQIRIGEDLKHKLEKYAEFLDATESYVVTEALRLVFNKDADFREWLVRIENDALTHNSDQLPVTIETPLGRSSSALVQNGERPSK
jgi:predicted transcriptional regulator